MLYLESMVMMIRLVELATLMLNNQYSHRIITNSVIAVIKRKVKDNELLLT